MIAEIALHEAQADFRKSSALIRGFVGGRGAGKSFIGALDLLRRARSGRLYLVGGPTYPQLRDTSWRTFREVAGDLNRLVEERISPPLQMTITTEDGGIAEVLFRSAENPENLRGPNLSGVWFDEASLMKEETLGIVIACLREKGEMGWMSLTFTPKGRKHWTYRLFFNEEQTPKPNADLIQCGTLANPFLPETYHESVKSQYGPQLAEQELEGRFIDLVGGMFSRSWFERRIAKRDLPEAITQKGRAVRYWDKAATENGGCYTAGVLLIEYEKQFYVRDVVRGQWGAWERNHVMQRTTEQDGADWKNYEVVVEQEPGSGGKESAEFTIQQLRGYRVTAERVTGSKMERAQPWASQLAGSNAVLVEGNWNRDFIDEHVSFPEGLFKDQVDAAAGAFNRIVLKPYCDLEAWLDAGAF